MSIIGPHLVIAGELTAVGDLTIEGRVEGRVTVRDATLTIAPSARVEADLRAARVVVQGDVSGAIYASDRIELGPTASVAGSLSAGTIAIAEGARVNATIDMGHRTIAARVAEYRAGRAGPE